jgi:hypothetical protein
MYHCIVTYINILSLICLLSATSSVLFLRRFILPTRNYTPLDENTAPLKTKRYHFVHHPIGSSYMRAVLVQIVEIWLHHIWLTFLWMLSHGTSRSNAIFVRTSKLFWPQLSRRNRANCTIDICVYVSSCRSIAAKFLLNLTLSSKSEVVPPIARWLTGDFLESGHE